MKTADPRVKLLWIVLCTSAALVFSKPLWLVGVGFFAVVGAAIFGADFSSLLQRMRRFLPALSLVFLVQLLFIRTGPAVVAFKGRALITGGGLERGSAVAVRMLVIFCSTAVMLRENSRRVINALSQMGLPYTFCFSLHIAIRFVPFFAEAFSQALTALQLRGIDLRRVPLRKKLRLYSSLLLPVVTDAVVQARRLVITMEARGFGALPKRTLYQEVTMNTLDWLAVLVLLSFSCVALAFYYIV